MPKIYLITAMFLFGSIMAGDAFSKDNVKMRLAILGFNSNNIKNSHAEGIRDMIEVELYKTGLFEILERNQFDLILKEKGYNKNCIDPECAVKIGKILSADKIIIGSVSNIGGINITIKFVDIKKGIIEYADMEKSANEAGIMDSVQKLSEKISGKIAGKDPEIKITKTKPDDYTYLKYYSLGVIPGLGQIYAGKTAKGYLFLGGFTTLAGFSGYAIYDFTKKRKAYENLASGTSAEYDSKYKSSENALNLVKISFGILGAFYLYNWVDIIFFSKPVKEEMIPENQFKSVTINVNCQNDYNSFGLPSEIVYSFGFINRF